MIWLEETVWTTTSGLRPTTWPPSMEQTLLRRCIWPSEAECTARPFQTPATAMRHLTHGPIADVSSGAKFYGVGRSYHHFVGRDASRAFATGCFVDECLSSSLVGLTSSQLMELDRWLELYEYHDSYSFVGKLIDDPVEDALERAMLEDRAMEEERTVGLGSEELISRAQEAYVAGLWEEARTMWRTALVLLGEDGPPVRRAKILTLMAAASVKTGNLDAAQAHFAEAIDILMYATEVAGGVVAAPLLEARARSDMAAAAYMQGRKDQAAGAHHKRSIDGFLSAIDVYESVLASEIPIADKGEALDGSCNSRLNLAQVLKEVGRGDEAQEALREIVLRLDEHERSGMVLSKQQRYLRDEAERRLGAP